jgi:hypothetical protein
VLIEHADDNQQILFVEKWLETIGKDVQNKEVTPHMSGRQSRKYLDNDGFAFCLTGIFTARLLGAQYY